MQRDFPALKNRILHSLGSEANFVSSEYILKKHYIEE